jgi:hypothetical protein
LTGNLHFLRSFSFFEEVSFNSYIIVKHPRSIVVMLTWVALEYFLIGYFYIVCIFICYLLIFLLVYALSCYKQINARFSMLTWTTTTYLVWTLTELSFLA